MDGLLIIDKPSGPTSHDVVARLRRALGETRIGHTGTLDPMASGVLPLVVGRATRLAQFLSASGKHYEALVRLGVETNTYDALGKPVGELYDGPLPSRAAIERALDRFRGSFMQQPPAFSAKKIGGQRSYRLARSASARSLTPPDRPDRPDRPDLPDPPGPPAPRALPDPVLVTTHSIEVMSVNGAEVLLTVACSAGFYVRSLAHDLGAMLGTGAHLIGLRRTRAGAATLDHAIPLDEAERDVAAARDRVIPLRALLSDLPSAVLSPEGVTHAGHGRELGPADFTHMPEMRTAGRLRLVDEQGELVGIGVPGAMPGLLHPSIVLM